MGSPHRGAGSFEREWAAPITEQAVSSGEWAAPNAEQSVSSEEWAASNAEQAVPGKTGGGQKKGWLQFPAEEQRIEDNSRLIKREEAQVQLTKSKNI